MTPDLWQLHTWQHAQCTKHYLPNLRVILISGYDQGPIDNIVTFDTDQELSMFTLKYSDYFRPLTYNKSNSFAKMMWTLLIKYATTVNYKQGPVQHVQ